MSLNRKDVSDVPDRWILEAPRSFGSYANTIPLDVLLTLYQEWDYKKTPRCVICLYPMKDQCL
ncbi:hypothetical protein MXB_4258, partial [Myxobolus squamalis]